MIIKNKLIIWPILAGAIVGIIYWFATMGKVTIMGINIFQLFGIAAFFAGLLLKTDLAHCSFDNIHLSYPGG